MRVWQGQLVAAPLGAPVDIAGWIRVDLPLCEVAALAAPPTPAEAAHLPRPSTREVFDDVVGAPPAELAELRTLPARRPPWWLLGMAWLRGRLARSPSSGASPRSPGQVRGPSLVDRAERWLTERMLGLGMGAMLGHAHAAYLDELLQRFEAHDLNEALRRAIPVGGEAGEGDFLAGLLRAPSPRSDLSFQAPRSGSAVVPLAQALRERLTQAYQRAQAELEAQGRVVEAAYVRAELLGQPREAVALLERHQRYRHAAELAEVQKLDAAMVVRLFFLAGELDRAVVFARREGVMAAAVAQLERQDPARARQLRVVLAATLAAAGAWLRAAELLPPGAEAQALTWLDHAIATGGPSAARAVALRLRIRPDLASVAPTVEALLAEADPRTALALGRVLRAWAQPVHALALGEGQAILLTLRGTVQVLTRLDLASGQLRPWVEVQLDQWASTCSDQWLVVSEGRLRAIDLAHPGWRSLHTVPLDDAVRSLAVGPSAAAALVGEEVWRWSLPSLTLRSRGHHKQVAAAGIGGALAVGPSGEVAAWGWDDGWVRIGGAARRLPPHQPLSVHHWPPHSVAVGGDEVRVFDAAGCWLRLVHEGCGAEDVGAPSAHLDGDHLTTWDHLGRVQLTSLASGACLAELRS